MPIDKGDTNDIREAFFKEQMTREKKLSSWLWIGAGGLGVLIAFFWGYSVWFNFSTFNWKKSEENKLLKKTSADWEQAFEETKKNEESAKQAKQKIKEFLNQALNQKISSTTPTTTTLENIISTSTLTSTSNR